MPETTRSTGPSTSPSTAKATQSDGAPSVTSAGVPSARRVSRTRSGRCIVFTWPEADQLRSGARTVSRPKSEIACASASRPGASTPSSLVSNICCMRSLECQDLPFYPTPRPAAPLCSRPYPPWLSAPPALRPILWMSGSQSSGQTPGGSTHAHAEMQIPDCDCSAPGRTPDRRAGLLPIPAPPTATLPPTDIPASTHPLRAPPGERAHRRPGLGHGPDPGHGAQRGRLRARLVRLRKHHLAGRPDPHQRPRRR